MKAHPFFVLAGISLSLLFSGCEKQAVEPLQTTQPDRNQDTGGGNGGSTNLPPVQPPAPAVGALLVELGQVYWQFDEKKRLLGYDSYQHNDRYTIVYEGDKAAKMLFETGHYLVYTWEGNRVVSAAKYWQDTEVRHFRFTYKGDKLTSMYSSSWYPDYPQGWMTVTDYEYDERGNLVKLSTRSAQSSREEDLGPASIISWGDFDNKANPQVYAQSDLYLPGVKLFENNPGYRDTGYQELFTYTYYESGLPKERFTRLGSHPHLPPFITTYKYQ